LIPIPAQAEPGCGGKLDPGGSLGPAAASHLHELSRPGHGAGQPISEAPTCIEPDRGSHSPYQSNPESLPLPIWPSLIPIYESIADRSIGLLLHPKEENTHSERDGRAAGEASEDGAVAAGAREPDAAPDHARGAFPGPSVSASASITCLHS
jgi:hypothetical protein